MTVTSKGYGGTDATGEVNAAAWAWLAPFASSGVPAIVTRDQGAYGWALTVNSATSRTATLGPGYTAGWGISNYSNADYSLTFDPDSGSVPRWDAVVLHHDWGTRSTSIDIVKGEESSSPNLPNALDATPGTAADHVLHLVPITPDGIDTDRICWASPVFGGGPLYYPTAPGANQFLNARNYPAGAMVWQYTTNGQPRIYGRRGGAGSNAKFVNILDPDWTDISLQSSMTSITQARKAQARIFCGHLELRGTIVPTAGGMFKVGGGLDGNYDLWHVPAAMRPSATRATGVTRNKGNIDIIYDTSTNILYAYVWNNNVDAIPLDGVRLPL